MDAWGNPPQTTLGMIVPDSINPFGPTGWGVIITYEEDGYVEDSEAENMDYTELLEQMQADILAANGDRVEQGYEPYELAGWAEPPHYDNQTHKLYWAMDLKFGQYQDGETDNTLNYNIRVLGRNGVLVLNAVSGMSQLEEVKSDMEDVLAFVQFQEGNRYKDFDPSMDKVAAYGIGGLIAGKIAAKAGFFKVALAFLAKSWKFILIGLTLLGGFIKKVFFGKENEQRKIEKA